MKYSIHRIMAVVLVMCICVSVDAQSRRVRNDLQGLVVTGQVNVANGQVGAPAISDVAKLNLSGPVKQLQVGPMTYTFNRAGYIIQEDCIMKPGGPKGEDIDATKGYKKTITYDEYNRPLSIVECDENNYFNYEIQYTYAKSGQHVKKSTFDVKGNVKELVDTKYDAKGKMTEQVTYDGDKNVVERRICKQANDKSNWVTTIYNGEGTIIGTETYFYDVMTGDCIEVVTRSFRTVNNEGEITIQHRIYKYTSDGYLSSAKSIREDGSTISETSFRYNSDGMVSRKVTREQTADEFETAEHYYYYGKLGEIVKRKDVGFVYEFDEWNTVKGTHPVQNKISATYTYEFDSHNNWIRCESAEGTRKNKKTKAHTRSILYY